MMAGHASQGKIGSVVSGILFIFSLFFLFLITFMIALQNKSLPYSLVWKEREGGLLFRLHPFTTQVIHTYEIPRVKKYYIRTLFAYQLTISEIEMKELMNISLQS